MATVQLFVLSLLAFNYAHCLSEEYEMIENPDHEIDYLKQFILDSFNANKESVYDYNHAHILDAQKRDGPERNYFMLLDIGVSCKKDSECNTKNLICEVIIKEDLSSEKKEISEDNSVCVKKLPPSMSMVNNGGFVEESVSEEVQRVAELAVEQLENEGDTKRTIFEIISVKTQDNADGKKLFLTLKVAKPIDDAVDMTEFETCEIEVSMNDPLVVENSTSCFPISEGQTDFSMSEDDMNEEAKKALNEINKLSSSPFLHVLVKVVTADRSVTPGSQGSVTTIQFQVAPSLCLKNGGGERESPAVRNCPPMSSIDSQAPLQCTLTAWERPWHPSTPILYSGPVCHTDKDEVSEEKASSSSVSDLSEEFGTTIEPNAEKKVAYCAGCITDLDVESENVRGLAQEVLTSMETSFAHRLVRVVKAQKQVVNGVRYIMTLEVVRTACPPEAARIDLNGCPEIDGEEDGGVRTCHIDIVERPWADSAREVIVNDCAGESPATRKDSTNLHASLDPTSVPQEDGSDLNEVVQAFDEMFGDDPQVVVPEVGLFDGSDFLQVTNDVPVIGVLHRERRGTTPGGLRDVLTTQKDKVMTYARFALDRMDDLDEDSDKRILEEVVSAKVQTVNGYKYHLTLKVSTSDCDESKNHNNCNRNSSKKRYLCNVQVHVPSIRGEPLRLLNSECSPIKETSRQRRGLMGGIYDADVGEPFIQELSNFAVDHLSSQSSGGYKKTLVRVVEAKKQVVSGIRVYLTLEVGETSCLQDNEVDGDCALQDDVPTQICNVDIWERAWLKKREVLNFTCEESGSREKRELIRPHGMPGGKTDADVNDPRIQEVSNFAVDHLSSQSSGEYKTALVRIVKAERQIVNGVRVYLTLEVGESSCRKDVEVGEECSLKSDVPTQICHVDVWDKTWQKQKTVMNFTCDGSGSRKKREESSQRKKLVGGVVDADVGEPSIQEISNFAVDHLNKQSSGEYKKALVRIVKANRRLVGGVRVYLTLEVGETSCLKDSNAVGDCPKNNDVPTKICEFDIWERSWAKQRTVMNFTCDGSGSRKKRELGNANQELYSELFSKFMTQYNKKYASNEERRLRFRIFRANMKKVKVLQETEQGTAIYGATRFADLSAKEFKKFYLGYNPHTRKLDLPMKMADIPDVKLPKEFDWRHYNVVTEVKNQGMCGSCWAFSVTGNVEGQWALRHDKLLSLSEQELVDCDTLDQGCNGGLMDQAYHAIENIGGLEDEQDYPYEGYKDSCHFKETEARVTLSGSLNISSNEDAMAKWLFKNGPISIALNANAMQFYFGGVSHPWKVLCDPEDLDHGVLIVGFGVHRTTFLHRTLPYWIIKNSWGSSWGEQGYYRIYRGDGTCGVNRMASSAIVN